MDLAHDELYKAFPGLRNSVNAVYKHMRTKYNLSLKRAEIFREERDSDTTIRKRRLYIEKCKENNVNYQRNCAFTDEAGFNLHITREIELGHLKANLPRLESQLKRVQVLLSWDV